MAKNICCWIQHIQKRIEAQKNGAKDEKALHKLMNNPVFSETMENWFKTYKQQKWLIKMNIKTKLYVTKNIWQWVSYNI